MLGDRNGCAPVHEGERVTVATVGWGGGGGGGVTQRVAGPMAICAMAYHIMEQLEVPGRWHFLLWDIMHRNS